MPRTLELKNLRPSGPVARMDVVTTASVWDTVPEACALAKDLGIEVRFKFNSRKFHITPSMSEDEAYEKFWYPYQAKA